MKKLLFLFAMALFAVSNVFAEAVEIDGLWYNLSETGSIWNDFFGKTAAVIPYQDSIKYSGEIVIPNTVKYNNADWRVTRIGGGGFLRL